MARPDLPHWARCRDDGVDLTVRVQPGARRSEITGADEQGLRVRLAAPARGGRANAELVRLLAEVLDVARRRISIRRGETGRTKTVTVDGAVDLRRLLPEADG